MDRDSWFRIGGYCEVDAFSMHIDSIFALTCHHAGIREQDLASDFLHFHIDHSLGNEIKPSVYLTRDKTELRHPSMMTLYNLHACMTNMGTGYAFNENCWGYAATSLPYEKVTVACWDNEGTAIRQLQGAEGCRIKMEDIFWDPHLLKRLTEWSDLSWDSTVTYLEKIGSGRKFALWGLGGRARNAVYQLQQRNFELSIIIDDKLAPLFAGAEKFVKVDAEQLSSDFFDKHVVVIAAIFAENIRAKLDGLGAVEGRDYIVTI